MAEFVIRLFDGTKDRRALARARAYAAVGGIALHVWVPPGKPGRRSYPGAPACFRRADRWGHLFARDPQVLEALARKLGVKRVKVSRRGEGGQHVDLCGKPLERAIALTKGR